MCGQWISVDDRLPELGEWVLVYTDDGEFTQGLYSIRKRKDGTIYHDGWDYLTLMEHGCGCCSDDGTVVTHWIPLPEPPLENFESEPE